MKKYYLAIDIGASSGRHILGCLDGDRLILEEIYRFDNNVKATFEGVVWDIEALVQEVINGIAECGRLGKIPQSLAIDTWGVDYVLLDGDNNELLPVMSYRDSRTVDVPNSSEFPLGYDKLYAKCGIQRQAFNTVYQLYCDKRSGKADRAEHFLMIPEYLSYKLTGVMKNEYTNATTTSMVNAQSKQWDEEIISALGLNPKMFLPLSLSGSEVGELTAEVQEKVGFNTKVLLAPSHDTASAVAACPLDDKSVYISSGTWSLMGTENIQPVLTEEARAANFTNEGGVEYRYRFLKNIMGMWLFQNVRRNLNKKYSYDQMMQMAEESSFKKIIDVNHQSLVCPDNMIKAVNLLAGNEELPICDTLSCIYHSLAYMYKQTVDEIEMLTGKHIERIYIVGGGSRDKYLNRLCAEYTGKQVVPCRGEATATGNLFSQIMSDTNITLDEARTLVVN